MVSSSFPVALQPGNRSFSLNTAFPLFPSLPGGHSHLRQLSRSCQIPDPKVMILLGLSTPTDIANNRRRLCPFEWVGWSRQAQVEARIPMSVTSWRCAQGRLDGGLAGARNLSSAGRKSGGKRLNVCRCPMVPSCIQVELDSHDAFRSCHDALRSSPCCSSGACDSGPGSG